MKIKNIIITGLVGVILAACTEEVTMGNKALQRNNRSLKIEVTDEFAAAATRADYSGFPSTTFETDDAIGVFAFDGTSYVASNIRFVKQSDGSWEPDEEIPYSEDYTFYAYFPYRSTTYTPSASGTVDAVDTKFDPFITDASNYFWQADQSTKAGFTYSNLMIAKGTVTDVDSDAATVKFTMKHKRGLAVFNGEDATEMSFTGNLPYQISSTKQFLMKPQTSTSFTDNLGTYSLSAKAGEYVEHSIVIPGIDLSKRDNAGNARATRTTANCYMVHEAGDYKIPLVYGNAIKDGTDNRVAYYPGEESSVTNGADQFVNHNGDGITGPWITKNGSGVDAGMGLTAASAELLWQDVTGLISTVSVSGNYLLFTVGTFNPGNALIAVKDGSGYILWSWHIWATEDDLSETTVIDTGNHTYTVAPVNIGWVPTGGDGKQGYCTYYQWGRKDPFIPSTGSENTNHVVYNIDNSTVTGLTYQASTTATIADNIKTPTCHYYNNSTRGSVTTNYYNMWDAQNASTNNVTTATKKTIYDPCPPGFCVPTGNLYYFMGNGASREMSTYDNTNRGAIWNIGTTGPDLWFPGSGWRVSSSGTVSNVRSNGYCWSATPSSTANGRLLAFGISYWFWEYYNRAYSCQIRPVAEE